VLALQGDVAEHAEILRRLGADVRPVRLAADLADLDGLIIPGGESTTIGKLLRRFELLEPLRSAVRHGFPVYGTCAGMILLSNNIRRAGDDQPLVGGMNVAVERNAFGSQLESFETDVDIAVLRGGPFHAIFIRAPVISEVGPGVEVLARLPDGTPVAARQDAILVSSFHPELTDDSRMHALFLDTARAVGLWQNGARSETESAIVA
jgi:5'-phosphate synthase pdxT subunit